MIARDLAYHGTTMGALAITGLPALRDQFEPVMPGAAHVANTNRFRSPFGPDVAADDDAVRRRVRRRHRERHRGRGARHRGRGVPRAPAEHRGLLRAPPGYFARVRDICDRHGVLLVSDEVICAFGRLGAWFGAERYGYQPDMLTFAKGVTSGYAPLAGVLCRDFLAEPFLAGDASFAHGITFGGHPVSCAVALANLAVLDDEGIIEHVADLGPGFGRAPRVAARRAHRGGRPGRRVLLGRRVGEGPRPPRGALHPRGAHRADAAPRGARGCSRRAWCAGPTTGSTPSSSCRPSSSCGEDELDEIEATLRTVLTEAGKHLSLS